jgi:DNA-binding NarL/FixJ family response regulator
MKANRIILRALMETAHHIRLLFIDDDTGYMAVAQHLLGQYPGYSFSIAWKQDGPSALAFLATHPPLDLLIVDYYLPETNGLDVVKSIRELGVETPIIFLTSNRDFRLAIEAMRFGVEDYVLKEEAVDSLLPRTIVAIHERAGLRRRIVDQRRAEHIATQRTEAIKELVVTVCHEFNNPLAAIKISTDILLRHDLPDDQRELVKAIDESISQVEAEITRLRDINFDRDQA